MAFVPQSPEFREVRDSLARMAKRNADVTQLIVNAIRCAGATPTPQLVDSLFTVVCESAKQSVEEALAEERAKDVRPESGEAFSLPDSPGYLRGERTEYTNPSIVQASFTPGDPLGTLTLQCQSCKWSLHRGCVTPAPELDDLKRLYATITLLEDHGCDQCKAQAFAWNLLPDVVRNILPSGKATYRMIQRIKTRPPASEAVVSIAGMGPLDEVCGVDARKVAERRGRVEASMGGLPMPEKLTRELIEQSAAPTPAFPTVELNCEPLYSKWPSPINFEIDDIDRAVENLAAVKTEKLPAGVTPFVGGLEVRWTPEADADPAQDTPAPECTQHVDCLDGPCLKKDETWRDRAPML